MPFGDRTGPLGLGPRTGRATGFCAGFTAPGSMNPVSGGGWFGFGRGSGRGRGRRCWYRATGMPGWARAGVGYPPFGAYSYGAGLPAKEEMDILRGQADFLKKQMDDIESRIKTLEKAQALDSE